VGAVTDSLRELTQTFQACADFVAVYITEAHARNEWPAGSNLSICDQPTTTEERLVLANQLVKSEEVCMPVLVDSISNEFEETFACWPVRFYIIQNGRIAFKAQPDGFMYGYNFNLIGDFLKQSTTTVTPPLASNASATARTCTGKGVKRVRDF